MSAPDLISKNDSVYGPAYGLVLGNEKEWALLESYADQRAREREAIGAQEPAFSPIKSLQGQAEKQPALTHLQQVTLRKAFDKSRDTFSNATPNLRCATGLGPWQESWVHWLASTKISPLLFAAKANQVCAKANELYTRQILQAKTAPHPRQETFLRPSNREAPQAEKQELSPQRVLAYVDAAKTVVPLFRISKTTSFGPQHDPFDYEPVYDDGKKTPVILVFDGSADDECTKPTVDDTDLPLELLASAPLKQIELLSNATSSPLVDLRRSQPAQAEQSGDFDPTDPENYYVRDAELAELRAREALGATSATPVTSFASTDASSSTLSTAAENGAPQQEGEPQDPLSRSVDADLLARVAQLETDLIAQFVKLAISKKKL